MSPILPSAETSSVYASLRLKWEDSLWLQAVCKLAEQVMSNHVHGDLPRWRAALQALPLVERSLEAGRPEPRLGDVAPDQARLRETLMAFHPWRKGPLELAGVRIDTEWRSDWKWERVTGHIDLQNQRVLDIGCGNGYFGWRMLAAGARLVVGIDPTLVFVMQWLACRHFAGDVPNYVLPLGVEDLPSGPAGFDTVFSMGVLYHRRDPVQHLEKLRSLMRPGGTLVLETLVLPGREHAPALIPESRYARMRNVWAIPSVPGLMDWLTTAGYESTRLIDVSVTTSQEQRSTPWMTFESLAESLDSQDSGRTLEGYPAPTRALIIAR